MHSIQEGARMANKEVRGSVFRQQSGGSSSRNTVSVEQKQNMFLLSRLRNVSMKGVGFQEALLVARLPTCP